MERDIVRVKCFAQENNILGSFRSTTVSEYVWLQTSRSQVTKL